MKCRNCGRQIPDNSIFCNWCGKKQLKEKEKELSVPKPRRLSGGSFFAQVTVNGRRVSVSAPTEEEYYTKARAVKAGLLEAKRTERCTVGALLDEYISSNSHVLSPSTLLGYKNIRKNRFRSAMGRDASSVNWQKEINGEAAAGVSPKSIKNGWFLISAAYRAKGLPLPAVNLPAVPAKELPWLDYEQISVFLSACRGQSVELAAILALHSLRRSEFMALDRSDIYDGVIHIRGAAVIADGGQLVDKASNKSAAGRRDIPVMIPRLYELLPEEGRLVTMYPSSVHRAVNRICEQASLPKVGCHGLRRSAASLMYHLGLSEREIMALCGWSDITTMHKFYVKLSSGEITSAASKVEAFYEKLTEKLTDL